MTILIIALVLFLALLLKFKSNTKIQLVDFLLNLLIKTSYVYIILIVLIISVLKIWYFNNLALYLTNNEIKYLSLKYNTNITKEVKNRLNFLGFKQKLVNKAQKDPFFNSIYVLSNEPTMGTYNASINTLLLTEDLLQYDEKNIFNNIKNGKYDETLRHEMIHYFLWNLDFRDEVFLIQSKILKRDEKMIRKYFNNDELKDFNDKIYRSYNFWAFSTLENVLSCPMYNSKNYDLDKFFIEFPKYKSNDSLRIIREELLTIYFQKTFPNSYKKEILNDSLVKQLHDKFFIELKIDYKKNTKKDEIENIYNEIWYFFDTLKFI